MQRFSASSVIHPPVDGQHLLQLIAQAHGRVERLHGVLIDHSDLVAAQAAQFFASDAHQFLALKFDVAPLDIAVGAQKVENGPGDGALAATRLADDAVRFAAVDLKGDILNCFDLAAAYLVRDGYILQFEDRGCLLCSCSL